MKDSAFERFDKQVKEIYLLIDKMEANPDDFSKEDKMEIFSYLEDLKTLRTCLE